MGPPHRPLHHVHGGASQIRSRNRFLPKRLPYRNRERRQHLQDMGFAQTIVTLHDTGSRESPVGCEIPEVRRELFSDCVVR